MAKCSGCRRSVIRTKDGRWAKGVVEIRNESGQLLGVMHRRCWIMREKRTNLLDPPPGEDWREEDSSQTQL